MKLWFFENSHSLVSQTYPDIIDKLKVTPHRLVTDVPKVQPGHVPDGVPVIGVLGNIGYQKGITVLRDLSQLLARNRKARLVIISNIDPSYKLASSVQVHGSYHVEEIPSLVARYGIICWLIPSIWPETFSYTTHEALATGLPVWSFDLGAQGDAARAAAEECGQGGVIPLKGATSILMMLERMMTNQSHRRCGMNHAQHRNLFRRLRMKNLVGNHQKEMKTSLQGMSPMAVKALSLSFH